MTAAANRAIDRWIEVSRENERLRRALLANDVAMGELRDRTTLALQEIVRDASRARDIASRALRGMGAEVPAPEPREATR